MEITPGRYRHFKGNEYEVLYLARHSETLEEMVVYRALYGERGVWVRPASMWKEIIERDGKTFRRFTKIELATGRRKPSRCLLQSSQKDLSAAAADDLRLPVADGDRLHRAARGAADIPLLRAVAQAVADPLTAFYPARQKPSPHGCSRVSFARASRRILVK